VTDFVHLPPVGEVRRLGPPTTSVDHPERPTATEAPCLDGLSVLVVGIYFAPDLTGIAPYTTAMCEDLALMGARVEVVTGIPHYPAWRVADGYRFGVRWHERRGTVEITRVRHVVPKRQDPVRRAAYELTFWAGARLAVRQARPDVVLAVTPNLGAVPVALAAGGAAGVPVGVVVQDLVGLAAVQSGMRRSGLVGPVVARIEGRYLRRADRLAVISPAFRHPLLSLGIAGARVSVLPNFVHIGRSAADRHTARRSLGWPSDRRLVLHTGNMGLKQDLGNVLDAARGARLRSPEMLFLLVGDGSTRGHLERHAVGLDNVRFLNPLPDAVYPVALAAADCLLVNERPSVRDMSLPSKLTSYFASARPIVAATREDGATAREVHRSGAGLVVPPGDPAALLGGCIRVCADSALAERLGRAGLQHAASALTRDGARANLTRFVCELLADGSTARSATMPPACARRRRGCSGQTSPAG
jgi:colanic acid biosynthesis glycosyl transferase WcaI